MNSNDYRLARIAHEVRDMIANLQYVTESLERDRAPISTLRNVRESANRMVEYAAIIDATTKE